MTTVHHLNCGVLHAPPHPRAACHCLLLEDPAGLALIDTGIGMQDVARPLERIGKPLIDLAGFQFHADQTAVRQIERLGLAPAEVRDVVLTHADPDHTGGLADFPNATVHVSAEEHEQVESGHWRYLSQHFAHAPKWKSYSQSTRRWFGLAARPLTLGFGSEVLLIPLFGHTLGHCGVAVRRNSGWLLHVGDAYYLRVELETDDHPISALVAQRADDNIQRLESLRHLGRLAREHGTELELFGYHDFSEFPPGSIPED